MGTRYSKEIKEEVLRLGKAGWNYSQLKERFGVPKSTLSVWFNSTGKMPDPARRHAHLHLARAKALETIRQKKNQRLVHASEVARSELQNLDLTDSSLLKAMLAMLYWAEGTKGDRSGGPKFVNTDPVLAVFYLSLLRKVYSLDETRIKIRLHLSENHDQARAVHFWSQALMVPKSQFGKIYVKKRSTQKKFRKNFQGICFIGYYDTSIRRELLSLGLQIAEKYQKLLSFNG